MENREKEKSRSFLSDSMRRFRRHKLAMVSFAVIAIELICVIALPYILKMDPYSMDTTVGFTAEPSSGHILGTDSLGRDVFSRVVYGGRTSLYVGIVSTIVSAVIGIPLGLVAGYYRGVAEMIIMRLSEIFLSVPSFILILVLVSLIGPSVNSVMLVIGIMGWPRFSKILYGSVLSVRERDYVEAARAVGTKNHAILWKYIFPNAFSPVLVSFTFGVASAILQESALSFLGMGVQPPEASWGNILYEAQSLTILSQKPWMWVPAGVLLMITVLGINFFGDGLRDALDPKMKL